MKKDRRAGIPRAQGLVDEYVLTVHPVALGSGKRVFTGKTSLELTGAKTYRSGVIRATYRPAR
jgi:dihydrofolate reductase